MSMNNKQIELTAFEIAEEIIDQVLADLFKVELAQGNLSLKYIPLNEKKSMVAGLQAMAQMFKNS